MKLQSSRSYKVIAHIAGWVIFFLLPLPLAYQREFGSHWLDTKIIWSIELRNLLMMGFFYLNLFYLTPAYLTKRGLSQFLPLIIGSVILVSLLAFLIQQKFMTPHFVIHTEGRGTIPPPMPLPPPHGMGHNVMIRSSTGFLPGPFFSNFLHACVVASISTIIVMWEKWNQAKNDEQERTLQKIAAELSVLKLQISPHFLFNTLNNIRWLVRSKSDQAEEAIVKLSQLLRYILYQTNQDKVPLTKEVEHLEDFISLQTIRLNNKHRVAYNFRGDFEHHNVVPLLFIPPVENFFKYADFDTDVTNQITLEVSNNQLIFVCRNKTAPVYPEQEPDASGIGLQNLQKRLALHYPQNHTLTIDHQKDYFEIVMTINLT